MLQVMEVACPHEQQPTNLTCPFCRDAEEMMLVEAIKQSLREAAKEGLVDPTPQASTELPSIPSQSPMPGEACPYSLQPSLRDVKMEQDGLEQRCSFPPLGVCGSTVTVR